MYATMAGLFVQPADKAFVDIHVEVPHTLSSHYVDVWETQYLGSLQKL